MCQLTVTRVSGLDASHVVSQLTVKAHQNQSQGTYSNKSDLKTQNQPGYSGVQVGSTYSQACYPDVARPNRQHKSNVYELANEIETLLTISIARSLLGGFLGTPMLPSWDYVFVRRGVPLASIIYWRSYMYFLEEANKPANLR